MVKITEKIQKVLKRVGSSSVQAKRIYRSVYSQESPTEVLNLSYFKSESPKKSRPTTAKASTIGGRDVRQMKTNERNRRGAVYRPTYSSKKKSFQNSFHSKRPDWDSSMAPVRSNKAKPEHKKKVNKVISKSKFWQSKEKTQIGKMSEVNTVNDAVKVIKDFFDEKVYEKPKVKSTLEEEKVPTPSKELTPSLPPRDPDEEEKIDTSTQVCVQDDETTLPECPICFDRIHLEELAFIE